jgi:photosystem II stability/assembly factor-like uncharacterized protein
MLRTFIIAALLLLLTACTAPPPESSASTASPSASTAPASTAPASPSPTASATPITLPSSAQLSASSANVVWALVAGTRLFRSTDRGDTWQERSAALAPFSPDREIAFISDTEGWLAAPGQPGTQCTFQPVGIAHTVDAGARWDQLVAAAPPGSAGVADRQCKGGLAFADAQRGFLSAWDSNSAPLIYRTVDGGRTWSASRPLPDPPGFTTRPAVGALRAGRVRAFGTTLLVTASGGVEGRQVSYVFSSLDGGVSWSYAATLPETSGAFAFVSESRWLQIAPPGSSKESTDGGATWHAFMTDYSQAAPIAPEIVFGDPLVGYATVRGAIQRTVDGGAHWTTIKTPGT